MHSGLSGNAVATVIGSRTAIGPLLSGVTPVEEALKNTELKVEGSLEGLLNFLGHFEMLYQKFPNYFLR